jgi:hypothetical protein
MATYHLSAKTISRSHGRSATGAAAYRSGARIDDERTGTIHDYQRRRGVEASLLILPDDVPDWASDRARLWNAAEQAETRKNSTVAREFEIALPAELDAEQRQRLAADFARELVARHGCAADVAIHQPGRNGDHRNHHAHVLLTTRRLTAAGFTEKTRELDDLKSGEIGRWRERFADLQNARLREAGVEARVDHRSLEAQGNDREATIHLGPTATALERRGVSTRLGESNRAVQASNAERQRDAEARREAERRETESTRPAEPQAAEAETHDSAQENIIQALREKTARLYPTVVFPSPLEAVFAEPPASQSPPPETTEAERQRRADEAEPARRQREAERQALLSADIPALERELSEWTRHREWLARHELVGRSMGRAGASPAGRDGGGTGARRSGGGLCRLAPGPQAGLVTDGRPSWQPTPGGTGSGTTDHGGQGHAGAGPGGPCGGSRGLQRTPPRRRTRSAAEGRGRAAAVGRATRADRGAGRLDPAGQGRAGCRAGTPRSGGRTPAAGSRTTENPGAGAPAGGSAGAEARAAEIGYTHAETETPISRARRISA